MNKTRMQMKQDMLEYASKTYQENIDYGIMDDSHERTIISMEITFPVTLNEERTIFPKLGKCDVRLNGQEGNYFPHFHVEAKNGRKFSCCVKLFVPEFFTHGIHRDIIKDKADIKYLDKFLREPSGVEGKTRWDLLAEGWISTYPDSLYPKGKLVQPDYTKLKG